MNISLPKMGRKRTVVFSTLLIIVGAFAYYFLVHVKSSESRFVARAYRVLERKAINVTNKVSSYESFQEFKLKQIQEDLKRINKVRKDAIQKQVANQSRIAARNRNIQITIDEQTEELALINKQLGTTENKSVNDGYNSKESASTSKFLTEAQREILSQIKELETQIAPMPNIRTNTNQLDEIKLKIESQDIFQEPELIFQTILEDEFFDEFIFLKEHPDSLEKEDQYDIIYQTFENKINLNSIGPFLQERRSELPIEDQLELDLLYLRLGPKMVKPLDVILFNSGYKLMFHHLVLSGEDFYLGGFVKLKKFRAESRKVEVFYLVLAILIILLVIIAMPILKLVLMSPIERLHIRNVTMVGASVIIGVPLILIITFSLHDFVIDGNNQLEDDIKTLSHKVENSFKQEVETILSDLYAFDSLMLKDKQNLTKLDYKNYPEFNHVFWINNEGFPTLQQTLLNIDTSIISLSERDYFKKVANDELWTYKHPELKELRFYLESIISWNDFSNEVAISIPSSIPGYPAGVMTSQLHSVTNPILPSGYSFAIVDGSGNVKLHSDATRILQENLLDETNNSPDVQAALFSRMPVFTKLKYRNINHLAFVQPINTTPLFLVTLYNKEFHNAEVQGIISLSVLLLFGSFSVVGLMILVLYIIQKRKSKLKIKTFLFNWLKPNEERNDEYKLLTAIFSIIFIVILFLTLSPLKEEDVLFTLVMTNAYLFLISYTWLAPKNSRRYTDKPTDRINFYWSFVLFIIFANLFYFFGVSKESKFVVILFQIFLLSFVAVSSNQERLLKKIHDSFPRFNAISWVRKLFRKNAYNLFLFVWLLLSSVLPIFYIFMISHNHESRIWEKYNQMSLAKELQQKVIDTQVKSLALKSPEKQEEIDYQELFFQNKVYGGWYLNRGDSLMVDSNERYTNCPDSSIANMLSFKLRPGFDKVISKSRGLAFNKSEEGSYQWCYDSISRKQIQLTYHNYFTPTKRKEEFENIYVTSQINLLGVSSFFKSEGWILILVVALILLIIYRTIDFCVSKIYATEYRNFKNTLPLTVENFRKISIGDDSITHFKQRQILLLGLPKSNKSNLLESLEGKQLRIDMIQLNHEKNWEDILPADCKKYEVIILENFEYGVSSHKANIMRLQLLEHLSMHGGGQLIISSNVHPSFITDFYQGTLQNLTNESDMLIGEYRHALETWRHIFSGFIIVHNPIKANEKVDEFLDVSHDEGWVEDDMLKQLFKQELNKGSFLPNLLPAIKDYFIKVKSSVKGDESKIEKEDIILRIQLLAESYYLGLWNTLTKQEKYIIYDLAKDRFVNVNNKNGIRSLLEKGLIVYQDELRIMNESFTNFVLSIIKKEEALNMEKEVRDKGSWSIISSVLGILVLGVLAFFFLGNPDFFNDFNALLGVIAALVGILPRMAGLLSFGSSKSSTAGESASIQN